MATEMNELLRELKAPNDPTHSHVSMGTPRGVYAAGSRMKEFWDHYLKAVKDDASLYLAENPGKEIPILVDIDIRVKKATIPAELRGNGHLYSEEQVVQIIKAYQKAIRDVVDSPRDDAFTCVLLEKKPYETEICGETFIKNGFHLHFPKLFLDKKVQEVYIIPIVKKQIPNLFDNIGVHDFIDTNSISVHWLLYGSKKQNNSSYTATKVFIKDAQESTFDDALGDYKCNQYHGERPIDCHGRVMELMPRILSISLYNRADHYYYYPRPSVTTPLFEEFQKIKKKRKEYDQLSVDKALEEANVLLGMLKDSRADDRATWLRVGYCLWNITQGDDDGLTAWLEFSERSDKFDESECLSLWHKQMRPSNFTLGTLKYYAKQDSPVEYNEMINTKTNHLVIEAVNGCHTDVAKILHNEYGNEFICTSISNKEWYQFKNHTWKLIDRGTALRERISSNDGIIIRQLMDKRRELVEESLDSDDDEKEDKEHAKKLKKINDLIKQCKSTPFKNHVMVECQEVFYNPEFHDLLNKDPYLVAFKNGVYDFSNDVFRDGNPEDYLSVSIPIDYVDFGSIDHPRVIEVDDFFQKIFPDPEVRDYFLDQACKLWIGGNPNKLMLFWTGTGNNGKSVTQTLFEKMLGKLAIKFNTTLITGKKTQTGAANPELARASDGVRWAVMDEPNNDEVISSGILKWLTGNDSFWARDLFQKGKETKEIMPLFKLHMICNNLPAIQGADKATWNRIRVIPFESTFVPENECPEDFEEQVSKKTFPMDPHFTDKIPDMVQALAWYLIQRWKTTNKLEQVVPDKVKAATDIYQQNNDLLAQFEQQCVFEKRDARLTPATLYDHFKEWFKQECPAQTVPKRDIIRQHFTTIWGEPEKGRFWLHKTCRAPAEDDSAIGSEVSETPTLQDTDSSSSSTPAKPVVKRVLRKKVNPMLD